MTTTSKTPSVRQMNLAGGSAALGEKLFAEEERNRAGEHLALRPARADDAALLITIYASTRAGEMAQVNWSNEQKNAFLWIQFEAQRRYYEAGYPNAQHQIILVADEPAGRLSVHRRESEIRVMDIALLPKFRGRGLGTRLLQDILDEGRRTGCPVTIHVESFNPAQRLYARLGFTTITSDGVYHLLEWRPAGVTATEMAAATKEIA